MLYERRREEESYPRWQLYNNTKLAEYEPVEL